MFSRLFLLIFCALALSIANTHVAFADPTTPSPSPSPALKQIGEVTTTSDRQTEPLSITTRPTFIITRAQIDDYGSRTVADAIAHAPGVNTFSYGPFGAQVDYGVRGSTPEQTLVLLDGVPISVGSNGTTAIGALSTIGVERIEIVESGASTLYGTSASGGVINIITSVPRSTYILASNASYADNDLRVASGNGTIGFGFERHVATNDYAYPALTYSSATQFPAGTRTNDYALQSDGFLSANTNFGRVRLHSLATISQQNIGVPGGLSFLSSTTSQTLADSGVQFAFDLPSNISDLSLTLSASRQVLAYNDPFCGDSATIDGRSQISLKDVISTERTHIVAGVDLSRESAGISFGYFSGPPIAVSESQAAAYAQLGYDIAPKTRIVVGLRGENDTPHGGVLAPAFGFITSFGKARFSANIGESFRVPTLVDLYYPGFSNPSLIPERARNIDGTIVFPLSAADVSVGWFNRTGSNFIALNSSFVPYNAQRAAVSGFVGTITTHPMHHLVTDIAVTNVYEAQDLTNNLRLQRNPVFQTSLGLTRAFDNGPFSFGVRFDSVGSTGDAVARLVPPQLNVYDNYTTIDAFASIRLASHTIGTIRVFNLGNEQYAPIFGYPSPGRTIQFELSAH